MSADQQDALARAHDEWKSSRFNGTEQSHEQRVIDTLAGFLDSPIITTQQQPWRPE